MDKVKTEKVTFDMLKPNSAFYLIDPIKHPNAAVHYTSERFDPKAEVWVLYTHRSEWIKGASHD